MAGSGYCRVDLQQMALAKLEDAVLLLANERYSSSYYLSGYVVEFGLKACISRQFRTDTIPDPDLARRIYTHSFSDLVNLAGLSAELKAMRTADPAFASNWSTVNDWTESIRYELVDSYTSRTMLEAIRDPDHGVLSWLTRYW